MAAKPIAILQHSAEVVAGFFEIWLTTHGLPYRTIRLDLGEPVPTDAEPFAGICSLGGPMSANDELPWVEPELALLRAADEAEVPVLGMCLGGQLLARSFGAAVTVNPMPEIGWSELSVTDPALARRWLDWEAGALEFFQWHGDTFALPSGARNFLASPYCAHQAYVLERPGHAHLGLQFHCEMTPALIRAWLAQERWRRQPAPAERGADTLAAVQTAEEILDCMEQRTRRMNTLAARLYERWAEGLAR